MKILTNKTISSFLSKLALDSIPMHEKVERIQIVVQFIDWLVDSNELSPGDAIRFRNELYKKKRELSYKQAPKLSLPLKYVGFSLGVLSLLLVVGGIYIRFFRNTNTPFAYSTAPVQAGRTISFQGRLTDSLGNPINAPIDITYNFYTVPTGGTPITGSTRVCTAGPDQDGVFSSLIGNDSGPSCNTELPHSIFTENPTVYLGVTVGTEPSEMTPRQQIANVGYAINSETLQGMPPGQSVSNVPFINQDGNMLIGASNPGIRSTYASSNFTISSAQATTIQSAGSGDITLSASEGGSLRFKAYNGTLEEVMTILNTGRVGIGITAPRALLDVNGDATVSGSLIAGGQIKVGEFTSPPTNLGNGSLYYDSNVNKVYFWNGTAWTDMAAGATQYFQRTLGSLAPTNITDDLNIGAVATGSAIVHLPGLTNNDAWFNLGTGKVGIGDTTPLSLFTVGNGDLFQVDSTGRIVALDGVAHTIDDVTGNLTLTSNSNTISLNDNVTFAGTTTLNSQAYTWPGTITNGHILQTNGTGTLSWVDPIGLVGGVNLWSLTNGSLYPVNTTLDLFVGGTSTASAKFAFINSNSGTPTASISGTTANVNTFIDGNGNISTTNRTSLVLGNSGTYNSTGNILLNPNGTGNVGIGATIPNYKLDVRDADSVTNGQHYVSIVSNSSQNAGVVSGWYANGSAVTGGLFRSIGALPLYIGTSTSPQAMTVLDNGNVGIGSTTPTAKLDVAGDASLSGHLVLRGTTPNYIHILNGTDFRMTTSPGGDAGNVDRLTLLSNGNLGIGTTAPAAVLDVNGNLNVETYATVGASLAVGYSNAPAGPGHAIFSGNVGIGTTTPLGSDGFAENSILSIVAPTAGGTNRERLIYAKVADSDNYFSVINTTSAGGVFLPTFVGYAPDSLSTQQAVSFDGRITAGNDVVNGIPAITFRAQQLDGSTEIVNRPIVGFGSGPSGNTMRMVVMSSGKVGIGTTAPNALLDINGNLNVSTYATVSGSLALGTSTAAAGPGNLNMSGNLTTAGNVTFSSLPTGIVHSTAGVLSSSALDLVNDITGILSSTNGGTGANNSAAAQYSIPYYSATGVLGGSLAPGTIGYVLSTNGVGGAPSWISASGVGTNYWNINNGALYPNNATLDAFIGGTASASAKFAFLNVNSGTPTASISGTTANVNTFIDGNGNISTTNRTSLVLGNSGTYNSTGNILLNPNGTGNVGIGTTSPSNPFQVYNLGVNSSSQIVPGAAAGSTDVSSGLWRVSTLFTGNNNQVLTIQGSRTQTTVSSAIDIPPTFAPTSGSVAWGAINLNPTINQTGGANGATRGVYINPTLTSATSFRGIEIANNAGYGIYQSGASSNNYFAGNIGIGSTTPGATLDIVGNLNVSTYATMGASLALGTSSAAAGPGNLSMSGNLLTDGSVTFSSLPTGIVRSTSGLLSSSAINLASGDVTGLLSSVNGGTGADNSTAAQYSVPYYSSTGVLGGILTPGSLGYVLSTNGVGGAPTWINASGVGTNYWNITNGAIYPTNSTLDAFIGGTASASAKFAFLNVDSGTPTASISGTTANVNTFIDGNGNISTTNRTSLILGNSGTYNSTGNILLNPNGTGNVGIGNTNPAQALDVSGNVQWGLSGNNGVLGWATGWATVRGHTGEGLSLGSNNTIDQLVIDTAGNVGIGITTPTAKLDVVGNATISGDLMAGGQLQIGRFGYEPSTVGVGSLYFNTANNTPYYHNGTSWTAFSSGSVNYWNISNGAIYPINSTLDMFIGGTASASAKFAFLNVNSGTPTASVAGSLANVATYLTGDGNLSTTNMAALTLGSASTGSIQLSPKGTTGLFVDGSGNVGIGTTTPVAKLDVYSNSGIAQKVDGGVSGISIAEFYRTEIASGAIMSISAPGGDAKISLQETNAGTDWSLGIDTSNADSFLISQNGAFGTNDFFSINTSGNVGIGDTTPAYLFTVGNGDLFQVDSSGNAKAPTLALGTYSIAPTDRVFTAGATTAMANTTTYTGVFSRTLTGTLTGNISNTTGLYSGLTINATDGMYSHTANALQTSSSLSSGNTIDTMRAAYLSVSNNSSALSPDTGTTATTSAALQANADNSAAGIISNQYGGSFISYNNSTGSITNARGINSQAYNNNATGLITTAYGGYNSAYTNVDGASISTAYGTYGGVNELAAQTTGGITTGYGGYFVAQDANTSYGLFAEALHNTANTETFTNAFGIRNDCESNGANVTISNCYGIQSTITETLGTITNGYSGYFSSAATMNTGYGVYSNLTGASPTSYGLFTNVTGAGTTNYGLYTNVANAGTNYSIYTNGAARSFLGGNLGIVANGYLNFGTTDGTGGYGFRDNGGTIEFKNSAGSWTGIGTGGSGSSNWTIANGSIYPVNTTLDAFIGGTASASAKFAFLNVNSGTPTASISGTTANVRTYIDGDGNIGTTNRTSLVLGNSVTSNSTGNILLNPNGVGNVGIGTTTPTNKFQVALTSNQMVQLGSAGVASGVSFTNGSILSQASQFQISGAGAVPISFYTGGTFNTMTAGTERVRIDTSGNMGIATTSPLAALDVRKTSGTTPVASISGATSKSTLVVDQSGVGDIMTASSSGQTRFVVKNNGNVGIGYTNPTYKLAVNGSILGDILYDTTNPAYYVDPSGDSVFGGGLSLVGGFTASSASVSGSLTMGYGGQLKSAYGPLNLAYKSGLDSWTTGLILQDTTGNVGIGTVAPVADLHVFSATNAQMLLETGANANATFNIFEDGGASDHGVALSLDGTNNVVSWQSVLAGVGTDVLSIPYAGSYANRIGINTTTPLASLDLRSMLGTIPVASISGNTSQAALIVDQSGVGDIFTASSSGETRFVIKSNGNVGIGVADPTGKLSIAGTSSTISNLSGDIVLDSASGNISFSNDNLINVANIASIGQIQIGGFASPPTSIGNGAMYYDTTNNKVFYWDGTIWSEMGSKYWQRTLGSLSPQYITDALNLGAIASGSALVHLPGTNNQDAWFNLGTGTVGIGTTTPDPGGYGYKLDVSGTIVADKYVDSASNSYYVDPAGDSVLGGNVTLGDIFMIDGTPLISSLNAGSYSTITIKGSGDTTTASLCVDEGTGTACDGKINAGTIDPPYTINGKKYATYLPSMTGVKEETTGKVILTERNEEAKAYIKRIALGNQPEDSDLWLFAKASNLKDQIREMTVLLSSNTNGKIWYSVDPATMVLTFYSSTPGEISYRLTAPRFDAGRWANTRHENDFGTGFILNDRGNILAGDAPTYTAPKIISQGSVFAIIGNFIEEFTAANQALFANITAGIITTQKIVSPLAEIDTLNVNNKIQSKEINTELLKASNSIETPRLNTNIIDIGTQSGQLAKLVINGLYNNPVVTIDAEGSATFAGTLTAEAVQTENASISGTLIAKEIQSETIDALSTQLASNSSTLASSYQTLSGDINAVQQELAALKTSPLPNASYYQNLDATYNSLSITDTANIYKAYISDSLVVGSLFMEDHSILALASDLSISSLGTITFFDGSVVMAKNGNITSKGEVTAASLAIKNEAGITVAEIDASGSARFNEVVAKKFTLESIATQGALIADSGIVNNINVPIPAIKTNAEVAGTGAVPQDAKEVIIYNDNVTEDSLIYLTPTSDNTQGQLSVSKKVTCTENSTLPCTPYFIVSSSLLIHTETPFNWLIIN